MNKTFNVSLNFSAPVQIHISELVCVSVSLRSPVQRSKICMLYKLPVRRTGTHIRCVSSGAIHHFPRATQHMHKICVHHILHTTQTGNALAWIEFCVSAQNVRVRLLFLIWGIDVYRNIRAKLSVTSCNICMASTEERVILICNRLWDVASPERVCISCVTRFMPEA